MFRKPIQGKKAKTISCVDAHLQEKVLEIVCKNPSIRKVSKTHVSTAKVTEKVNYIQVMDADIEGASVRSTKIGKADDDITLSNLFCDLAQNSDDFRKAEQGGEK